MTKKIFFWSIVAVFIAGLSLGYYYLSSVKKPKHEPILELPDSCFLVLEMNDYSEFIKRTTQTNLFWQELQQHNINFSVIEHLGMADSLLSLKEEANSLVYDNHVSVAFYGTVENPSILYTFTTEKGYEEKWIDLVKTSGLQINKEIGKKSSRPIYVIKNVEKKINCYASIKENEIIASSNLNLLDAALSAQKKLGSNAGFLKCRESSGNKNDLQIYTNWKYSNLILNQDRDENPHDIWIESDLDIRPNELLFNGALLTDSSGLLQEISKQEPCEILFPEYCPQETKSFTFWGMSDFSAFLKSYFEKENKISTDNRFREISNNIENELVRSEVEFEKGKSSPFVQIRLKDRSRVEEIIREISDSSFAINTSENSDSVYRFTDTMLTLKITAGLFRDKMNFIFFQEDYLILSEEKKSCMKFAEKVKNKQLLSEDENFKRFCKGNISDECNFLRYDYLPRTFSPDYLQQKIKSRIDYFPELFKKFHSAGWQLISGKNKLIVQGYYLYSPTNNASRQSVWEARLDTTLASAPELVVNHKTGLNEIIAQDVSGNIYLISNTGNILWKKQIPALKKGKIFQVDYFNNNKLQFLFNTKNEIYLIDRNGKDVNGFPLRLKYPATNSISVFDYENNKDYRVTYCDSLKKINLLKLNGKNVEGFQSPKTQEIVTKPIEWHRIESKDVLLITDSSGNLYALNRKGETKINFDVPISKCQKELYLYRGKEFSRSAILFFQSSTKSICKQYFNKTQSASPVTTTMNNPNWQLEYINNENNPFLILTENSGIEVYDQEGNPVAKIKTNSPLQSNLKKIMKNKDVFFAGITLDKQLILLNANWQVISSDPIQCSWQPYAEMLNDDGFFYWIAGFNDLVSCYSF